MNRPPLRLRFATMAVLLGLAAMLVWAVTHRPTQPSSGRIESTSVQPEVLSERERARTDARLVRQLIEEDLGERRFAFPTVVLAASDRKMIPLDRDQPSHQRVLAALGPALDEATRELSQAGSPIRELRRINEGSRYFEEALLEKIDAIEGLSCSIPTNREGRKQRTGYPDLRIVDEATEDVFYLDPKLVEQTSWESSFRTFYFEPKSGTLKINDDAVHLLAGIGHDGKDGEWTFSEWKLVDLSQLEVRLKAEFQASNKDLYQ